MSAPGIASGAAVGGGILTTARLAQTGSDLVRPLLLVAFVLLLIGTLLVVRAAELRRAQTELGRS